MNMLATIVPKSDQVNADDLIGRNMTIIINEVKFNGGTEQPVSMYFDGSDKAFRPCKSMCRVLVAAWGPDAKQYVGRSLTLYRDPSVKWGGMEVGGIRISHMSDIDSQLTMALTATKGSRKPFTVKPLANTPAAATTGIDRAAAEADLRNAGSLDELKTVWSRKVMAPHRDALAALLDERKAALAFDDQPGPDDSQRGETHPATESDETKAAAIITAFNAETTSDALDAERARRREQIDALPEQFQDEIQAAFYARHEVLK